MNIHELKIWPEYFKELVFGNKYFEIRKHDRDFKVGDTLQLREWEENLKSYTGRESILFITYILTSKEFAGLAPGYSALGIDVISPFNRPIRVNPPKHIDIKIETIYQKNYPFSESDSAE